MKLNIFEFIRNKFCLVNDKSTSLSLDEKLNLKWDELYSSYSSAVKHKKIIDFYLGKNDYFHLDKDYGNHNISISFNSLIDYSKKVGHQKTLNSFKNDIKKILVLDLSCIEFFFILQYISLYLNFIQINKIDNLEWKVENSIRVLIKNQFNKLILKYPPNLNYHFLDDGYHIKEILLKIENIKEREGIDLLKI